jgi:hypothetical protein
MRSLFPVVVVTGLVGLLGGCAPPSTALLRDRTWQRPAGAARLVIMPVDIQLSELTAGGLLEAKAEWTERGREHVAVALERHLQARGVTLVPYTAPGAGAGDEAAEAQLMKLHDAVGGAILVHKYVPVLFLPTKENRFDWTLGTSVRSVQARTGADYALFVFLRDSYASAGRVALMVGAALVGVGVPGGQQVGVASLVDLRSGDILWFNRLVSPAGDLRTPEPAAKAVQSLLIELPL